jgi:hypothetical protein
VGLVRYTEIVLIRVLFQVLHYNLIPLKISSIHTHSHTHALTCLGYREAPTRRELYGLGCRRRGGCHLRRRRGGYPDGERGRASHGELGQVDGSQTLH